MLFTTSVYKHTEWEKQWTNVMQWKIKTKTKKKENSFSIPKKNNAYLDDVSLFLVQYSLANVMWTQLIRSIWM